MTRYVIVSGCSGGGKSTLLGELQERGFAIAEEPGRRIVKQQIEAGGEALPWVNMAAFAQRAIETALQDLAVAARRPSVTFFDRGLIDAVAGLHHATGEPMRVDLIAANRFHVDVFMTPPWPELYQADSERRHGLEEAVAEYDRLMNLYPSLGYRVRLLPKTSVARRADYILSQLPRDFLP
ncbi:AAA family ATPase [Neorhizobium sp. R1-B]|uniref:AAA family ATPase n=1 Tax=Neorhizobium sp. R1-B TaxID=2485162 RepID=UPI0010646375|nr:AAA family ATPase [Neorhizobium sp. R1-B]